jgi:hypothetical protein
LFATGLPGVRISIIDIANHKDAETYPRAYKPDIKSSAVCFTFPLLIDIEVNPLAAASENQHAANTS